MVLVAVVVALNPLVLLQEAEVDQRTVDVVEEVELEQGRQLERQLLAVDVKHQPVTSVSARAARSTQQARMLPPLPEARAAAGAPLTSALATERDRMAAQVAVAVVAAAVVELA